MRHTDFYPRPPRGGRPEVIAIPVDEYKISIHALREEGDPRVVLIINQFVIISIHALREEGDGSLCSDADHIQEFLSTPSARRATLLCLFLLKLADDFYPRPPRGGRQKP